jgi:putative transposase
MDELDKIYTDFPFYGQRKIKYLMNKNGYEIGRKKIRSLMAKMGLETQYPKPKLSLGNKEHDIYPYLLKKKEITDINQVWSTDLTYIKMQNGWIYLVAMIDWFSRFVLSWQISNSMNKQFCVDTLNEALTIGKAEIHNSDQGSQFTSNEYLKILKDNNVKISMDARGRCFDNIFIERFWRTVKYEEVYLKDYESVPEAFDSLKKYFYFFNYQRPHQSLNYKTPAEVYYN